MGVVWDPAKAAANVRKHRILFSDAATVLDDPMAVTIEDKRHAEQRFVSIGSDLVGKILVVVYSYAGDEIRLISARKATRREREAYEEEDR